MTGFLVVVYSNAMNDKNWSDVVGMPDEEDKKNLQFIINLYERTHPGEIGQIITWEKQQERENAFGGADPFLVKNQQSGLRKVLALPPDLVGVIKESYPTLFKDRKHFSWFVRNFPMFMVADKY